MTRTAIIDLSLYATVLLCGGAVGIRAFGAPGAPSADVFVLASPVFFAIAAKRATRLRGAAVGLAIIGVVFGAAALAAAWSSLGR